MMARIFFAGRAIERREEEEEEEEGETTRNATPSDDCEDVMNIHLAETNARTIQDSENARKEIERRWKARERTGERGKRIAEEDRKE